jgi:hypothetical protein
MNREFSEEEVQIANKYTKKCSTSLTTKDMQIKSTLRFHFTSVIIAVFKNKNNNKCWWGCNQIGTLIHCWWESKLAQPLWKAVWRFL